LTLPAPDANLAANPAIRLSLLAKFRFPLVLLLFGVFLIPASFSWDTPVREAFVASQGPNWKKSPLRQTWQTIRKWGDWPQIMVVGALGFLVAKWKGNRRWSRIFLTAMVASTLAGMVANASRLTTGRTRPRESPKIEQGFYGPWHEGRLLIGVPAYNSFPSGHTATAFGFAAVIVLAAPAWGLVLALPLAVAVAWASLGIGAHHPSDVTVSILIAFAVAWGVLRFAKSRFPDPARNDTGSRMPV
jgi:membrane-associated phospholipid phosphatase